MIFKEFDWPQGRGIVVVPLPDPDYPFFDPLLVEAEEQGLRRDTHMVWGSATSDLMMAKGRTVELMLIGAATGPEETNKQLSVAIDLPNGAGELLITVWHMIIRLKANPIQLHAKWVPDGSEHRAFLNIQAVEKRDQIDAISTLIDAFHLVKARRGRPKGSIKVSPVKFEQMRIKTINYRKKKLSWEEIAGKLKIDLKTLYSYREIWGINSD